MSRNAHGRSPAGRPSRPPLLVLLSGCALVLGTGCGVSGREASLAPRDAQVEGDADSVIDARSVADAQVEGDTDSVIDAQRADAGGRAAPDGGALSRDAGEPPGLEAGEIFDSSHVIEIRMTLDPADAARLEEQGDEEVYLPAAVELRGGAVNARFEQVGVRHKGAWTLHHCFEEGGRSYDAECAKLSYKIRFDEFVKNARLFGLKRLNLHAMSADGSKLREQLAYDLFRAFGVEAPRTGYAQLWINGAPYGLFCTVEQIDGRYTAFRYPGAGDGNLYKEVWPGGGSDDANFLAGLKTNNDPEDPPDVSDMRGFAAAVQGATAETFATDMARWVDLRHMVRYMAVDRAIRNWDGVVTFYSPNAPHNYYWYHEEGPGGVFRLIPWDLDNTFGTYDPIMHPERAPGGGRSSAPMPDWNVKPGSCRPRSLWEANNSLRGTPPGCDPFLNLLAKTQWDGFVEAGEELLAGPLQRDRLEAKLDAWQALIEPFIDDDPYLSYAGWQSEVSELHALLPGLIADFEAHLGEGYREE